MFYLKLEVFKYVPALHTATHTTSSFLNSCSFEHYGRLVCEDKGQPHIMAQSVCVTAST